MSNLMEGNKKDRVTDIYFRHAVDKELIPTVDILGVRIAAINMEWLLEFSKKHIQELSGDYMCVSNVHTTVMSYKDNEYRNIQNGGIMAIPDGGPLSTVGRKRGATNMRRTTGPSYMEAILKMSDKYGWKHYLYGSTPQTINRVKEVIENMYPKIKIVGTYSPPFRPISQTEDENIIKSINDASPDFIWVALGAPKQEKWMAQHQGKVKGFMVGVGAGFDYLAGNIKRAPRWMQKNNLEWLYRLIQDPKRLFKRYLITNSVFLWNVVVRRK